jgi:hypothetical protein
LSSIRPDAKIVIVLRNPVDLVFSEWKWLLLHREKRLVDNVPFLASFSAYTDKLLSIFREAPGAFATPLLLGIYATSVAHWLRYFGRSNVMIVDAADYFKDRNGFLCTLEEFLGLPHIALPGHLPVANRNPLGVNGPDPETSAKLRAFFAPYNRRLWSVIGTNFPW